MIDRDDVKIYQAKLEEEKRRLLKEIAAEEKPQDFGDDSDHFDEEADEAEELGNRLAAAHDLKTKVGDIEIALGKIAAGAYGRCESCGGPIEKEILDIAPSSKFCRACKKKASEGK